MTKPIIGIVPRSSTILNNCDAQAIEETYRNAIIQSGGIPIAILPTQVASFESAIPREMQKMTIENKEDLNQLLYMCDGIISPGGFKTYEYNYYICQYAREHNIPMLGICAGMQIMSRTGDSSVSLERNIMDIHKNTLHNVTINKDTLLYDIIGNENIKVSSHHNYHVSSAGINSVSAISEEDGIIEAIEDQNLDFFLGLQWHPEKTFNEVENSKKLFKRLIYEANKRKKL